MKKIICHFSSMLFAFFCIALCQLNAQQTPITKINFHDFSYDFGEVEEGEIVTKVYTFTNTGSEPLILVEAKGSCGCTVPQWPRGPIQPGETSSITVEFNSKNKSGQRNQKVSIVANTDPPMNFIYLSGLVTPSENWVEPSFNFGKSRIERKENGNCFAIYPNPTSEILKLELNEHIGQKAWISIFSESGQLMAEKVIKIIDGPVEFIVDHYPAGTYVARVQIDDQTPESKCFLVLD